MSSKRIIISGPDTLTTLGLRHLLRNCFAIKDVTTIDIDCTHDGADLYFVTPDVILLHTDFYMIRGSRTVVITSSPVKPPLRSLDPDADEENMIYRLDCILDSVPETTAQPSALSSREIEVVKLVATGHINKEIADILSISLNTVITHRKNISAKLGIRSSAALSVYALMNGIV